MKMTAQVQPVERPLVAPGLVEPVLVSNRHVLLQAVKVPLVALTAVLISLIGEVPQSPNSGEYYGLSFRMWKWLLWPVHNNL